MHKTGAMSSSSASQDLPLRSRLAGALALAAAILVVFYPALAGEYVYDDLLVVLQNPQIRDLANLPAIFGSSYWDFLDVDGASHVGYYRPLTMVLMTIANVFGNGEPGLFHWFSLIVYAGSCYAAWRFAARLMRNEGAGFLAALLFAVHPLHVESVAWISALHDPLFAMFGFLALERMLRWRDAGAAGKPWLAGVWFLLALLSKDAAVAILPVAWVMDVLRVTDDEQSKRPGLVQSLASIAPLLIAFGFYYVLRIAVFGDALAGFDRTTTDFGVGLGRLAMLRVELLGGALALLVWPAELNLFRPFQPELALGSTSFLVGAAGSVILFGAIALAWVRRWRVALGLLILIPAALAPVLLKVESLGTFPLSDRFLFIPVLGMTGLLAMILCKHLPRGAAIGTALVLACLLGYRSHAHLPNWANEEALFRNAVAQNPRNPNVYWGLGRVMMQRYRETGVSDPLLESRSLFEQSMDLLAEADTPAGADIFKTYDDHLQTNLGLGFALLYEAQVDKFHDYETARKVFERVIKEWPDSERGYIGLGVAWMASNDPNQAGNAFRKALTINPMSPEAHRNMGVLYMRIEEWESAAEEFSKVTQLRNSNPNDLVFLARARFEAGDYAAAGNAAQTAHEMRPGDPDPMVLIGQVQEKARNYNDALGWFDRAIAVSPTHGTAHLHRGRVLAQLDQKQAAVKAYIEACRVLPDSFAAHYDLMVLLLDSNQPQSALPYFLVAYRTRPQERDLRMRKAAGSIHQDNVSTLGALATIDADRGDLHTGLVWISRAMELAPEDPATNFMYGVILAKLDRKEEAMAPLELAANGLPGVYEAQMEYADILLGLNYELKAGGYLARALTLLEDHPMEPGVKKLTRETIQKALVKIEQMKQIGPVAPDEGE